MLQQHIHFRAVQAQSPGARDLAPPYDSPSDDIKVEVKAAKKAGQSFVVGRTLRSTGKDGCEFIQVHSFHSDHRHQKQGEKCEAGAVPGQVGSQGRLNPVNLVYEEVDGKGVVIPGSPPRSSTCQIPAVSGL